ncbi:MMPL family transporter [Nonomuraea sp. B12E4]|uniref:MMPL family transporter n=1 Tax=Nonomuraea sp. B12E4 TaxID=3153564 RepID=UPI00325DC01B
MFEFVGRLVHRGRWTLSALTLAAAVLAAPLVAGPPGQGAGGGPEDPRTDSATAARWSETWYGGAADVVVLYRHPTVRVRDPRYRRAVHDSLRRLPGSYVREVVTYWTGGAKEMVSRDGRSTYALVTLRGGPQAKREGYAAIEARLRDVENLRVAVGGPVPLAAELDDRTAADLARVAAVAAPVLLVLLVLVSGSLVAAVLPLVVGAVAVLGALAWLRPTTDLSWYVVVLLGFGLAVDYSLFMLRAFRAELRGGAGGEQAVVRTMATAGRTAGGGHAVASSVPRRPLPYAVVVVVVLLVLAFPLTRVTFGSSGHRALPAAAESRQVAETVERDFTPGVMAPIDVHVLVERSFTTRPATPGPLGQGYTPISAVTRVTAADVRPLVARLERLPQVTGVRVTGLSQANGAVRLAVRHESTTEAAPALVRLIRSMPPEPNVRRVVVGGPAATQVDTRESLLAGLPWPALMLSLAMVAMLLAAAAFQGASATDAGGGAFPGAGSVGGDVGGGRRRLAASAGWVVGGDGWPVVFGVDTDPVPMAARYERAESVEPVEATGPLDAGEVGEGERMGWVKVAEGRARAVRPGPGGSGWVWVEVDD